MQMTWPIYKARFDYYCDHCDIRFWAPGIQDINGMRDYTGIQCPECSMETYIEPLYSIKLEMLSSNITGHSEDCRGNSGTCYHADHWNQLTEHAKKLYLSVYNDPRDGGELINSWEFWNILSSEYPDATSADQCDVELDEQPIMRRLK